MASLANDGVPALIREMESDMSKSLDALKKELSRVRTGRASAGFVEPVQVDYYGSNVPLNQVANVTTPDAKTIQIAPWEQNMVGPIEKAILAANLGFTPQNDGKIIRIPMPALTEERRKDLVKMIKKMGEDTKVAIRNHRRDANEQLKKGEKSKDISEDEAKRAMEEVQKKTDSKVADVDQMMEAKEKEILSI